MSENILSNHIYSNKCREEAPLTKASSLSESSHENMQKHVNDANVMKKDIQNQMNERTDNSSDSYSCEVLHDACFIAGDVVVLKESNRNKLFTIENISTDLVILSDRDDCISVVDVNQIRTATIAEIQAKRRLQICETLTDDDITYHASPSLKVITHDPDHEKHLNNAMASQKEVS